jgi:hypothetical protein
MLAVFLISHRLHFAQLLIYLSNSFVCAHQITDDDQITITQITPKINQ